MEVKLFEVRDRATFLSMIAIKIKAATEQEIFLTKRAGYDTTGHYVLFSSLDGGTKLHCDAYSHDNITRVTAHHYIEEHWNELKSGDVIDCEYIRGETKKPKQSERIISNY